jgi:hypothetical protein
MITYIAARYSRKVEMKSLVEPFKKRGITVNSRWLEETNAPEMTLNDVTKAFKTETAIADLEDIDAAESVAFFAEDPLVGTPRGGRHVEFGYALAKGKKIFVIGGPENIFHYLTQVKHYDTVQEFLEKYEQSS